MADTIRDGYYEETNNYIPLRPTNVERYVQKDPKDYIVSPEELKKYLTSGDTGGTEHDAEQDRKLKELLGLTDNGKLDLDVSEDSVVKSDMNISEAVSVLANQTTENKKAIETLNGDEDTEGSIKNTVNATVNQRLEELVNGAPEAFDTLKEIADWIDEHGDITNGINDKLQELVNKDTAIEGEIETLQSSLSSNITRLDATDNELVRLIGVEQGKNEENKTQIEQLKGWLDHESNDRLSADNALRDLITDKDTETKSLIQAESDRAKGVEDALSSQIANNWSETVNLVDNLSNIHTQHVTTLVQAIKNVQDQQTIDRDKANEKFNNLERRVTKLEEGVEGGEFTI